MKTEMVKAWDEYIGEDGDPAVHPMFAAAFAAGWRSGCAKVEQLHATLPTMEIQEWRGDNTA